MIKQQLTAFLTFNGNAEEAINFYCTLPKTKVDHIVRYNKHPMATAGEENKILTGVLQMMGQDLLLMDMTSAYPAPAFSWATSLFVYCETEEEFYAFFNAFKEGGSVMMEPEPMAHFKLCTWVTDKFGVTWQVGY